MRCLVIHGSPRRGNTWKVLNLAKEEMKRNGDVEFIDIELRKENIPTCLGCFNCILKGEDKCAHKEAVSRIVMEIERADALIITSPVYSMQVTGLLKNFIDHMSYNFHRPKYFTKKALVITTTAGAGHTDTANYIKSILYYWGFNYVHTIPIAYRSWDLTEKNRKKVLVGAKTFMNDLNTNKLHKPSTKSVVMFNLWKGMSNENSEYGNADYDYWKETGLNNYNFSPNVKVGVFKNTIGKLVCKIIKK